MCFLSNKRGEFRKQLISKDYVEKKSNLFWRFGHFFLESRLIRQDFPRDLVNNSKRGQMIKKACSFFNFLNSNLRSAFKIALKTIYFQCIHNLF